MSDQSDYLLFELDLGTEDDVKSNSSPTGTKGRAKEPYIGLHQGGVRFSRPYSYTSGSVTRVDFNRLLAGNGPQDCDNSSEAQQSTGKRINVFSATRSARGSTKEWGFPRWDSDCQLIPREKFIRIKESSQLITEEESVRMMEESLEGRTISTSRDLLSDWLARKES
ncbi:hypothetical protein RSAG8_11757, partial [Rhizoctonia solani AG-8 WAC10335]